MRKLTIKQNPEKKIPVEILAQHIQILAGVGKKLAGSRLKEKTILVLLQHSTGISQKDIKQVLDALSQLEKTYLK